MTQTNTDKTVSTERLREMLEGLEGVTPGPWHMYGEPDVGMAPEPFSGSIGTGDMEPVYRSHENLAHIARCDPDTMRAIITELLASRTQSPAEWQVEVAAEAMFNSGGNVVPWKAALHLATEPDGASYLRITNSYRENARIALRAASITPPAPERPKEEVGVKPLEWREYHPGCFTASAAGHFYTVSTGNGEDDEDEGSWYYNGKRYGNPDAAKAIAENDHDACILSALEPSPIHKGEAFVWAVWNKTDPNAEWDYVKSKPEYQLERPQYYTVHPLFTSPHPVRELSVADAVAQLNAAIETEKRHNAVRDEMLATVIVNLEKSEMTAEFAVLLRDYVRTERAKLAALSVKPREQG